MDFDATFSKGVDCLERGDFKSAARHFRDATMVNPVDYNSWLYLGIALNELEERDEALVAFKKCQELDGNKPYAWSNAGIVYLRKNDVAEAVRHLYKAARIDPMDINTRLNLAMAYLQMRNKELEALHELQFVVEHDDSIPDAWHQLGLIFLDTNRRDLALFCFEKAKALGMSQGRNARLVLDLKFDEVKPINPLDPSVRDEAFNPFKKDLAKKI